MITLVTSRIKDQSPDISLLQNYEQFCSQHSEWFTKTGPVIFEPRALSSRIYTICHSLLRPLLKRIKKKGAVISLGLPYRKTLLSKAFPYYTLDCDLRVLWTYDVWEPDYKMFERLVRETGVNVLLLSSSQATEHFKTLDIPECEVHWIPETINPSDYQTKDWLERKIDVLSFGRSWSTYHNRIVKGCEVENINYQYQERSENRDVAVNGLKKNLQFPTWQNFVEGLADSKVCVCFPRCITHPELAGNVSTLTLRYLQAMASKCLILGQAPTDLKKLLDYNPVVEVDWNDPLGQIKDILTSPQQFQHLIDMNYKIVSDHFHYSNSIEKIDFLVKKRLYKYEF